MNYNKLDTFFDELKKSNSREKALEILGMISVLCPRDPIIKDLIREYSEEKTSEVITSKLIEIEGHLFPDREITKEIVPHITSDGLIINNSLFTSTLITGEDIENGRKLPDMATMEMSEEVNGLIRNGFTADFLTNLGRQNRQNRRPRTLDEAVRSIPNISQPIEDEDYEEEEYHDEDEEEDEEHIDDDEEEELLNDLINEVEETIAPIPIRPQSQPMLHPQPQQTSGEHTHTPVPTQYLNPFEVDEPTSQELQSWHLRTIADLRRQELPENNRINYSGATIEFSTPNGIFAVPNDSRVSDFIRYFTLSNNSAQTYTICREPIRTNSVEENTDNG
jgi:hypothetical protein